MESKVSNTLVGLATALMLLSICQASCSDILDQLVNEGEESPQTGDMLTLDELGSLRRLLDELSRKQKRSDDGGPLEEVVNQQAQELSSLKAELQAMKTELELAKNDLKQRGSTFIRWGRSTCPSNSHLVYSGVAGGSYYGHSGGGVNHLCLTSSPQFDNTPLSSYYGLLYGSEYDHMPGYHNEDVPCCVCRAPQSTTIMVPATRTCPSGMTAQYYGHLASHYYGNAAGIDFVCLDQHPEDRPSGQDDHPSNLFTYTFTKCGSLPCPPYAENKAVTCVVCSA